MDCNGMSGGDAAPWRAWRGAGWNRCRAMLVAWMLVSHAARAQVATPLADAFPGASSSSPTQLVGGETVAYMLLGTPDAGREVFVTNGRPGGTRLALDMAPGPSSPYRVLVAVAGDRLVAAEINEVGPDVLWFSTGDPQSASTLPGYPALDVRSAWSAGTHAFLEVAFQHPQSGFISVLLRTDGTPGGTVQVEGWPNNTLVAVNHVPGVGHYLHSYGSAWKLDAAGVLTPIITGCSTFNPRPCHVGSVAYWECDTRIMGSDGTEAGTRIVFSRAGGESYEGLDCTDDFLLLRTHAADVSQLHRVDDTHPAGIPVGTFNNTTLRDTRLSTVVGNKVVFTAQTAFSGEEPWVSDGTTAGTRILADINPGSSWSYPTGLASTRTWAVFRVSRNSGDELWVTRGTPETTRRLTTQVPSLDPAHPASFGAYLLYVGATPAAGEEPWSVAPCGDGILAPEETCETHMPCCSGLCEWQPAGTACEQDAVFCNGVEACDGTGACLSPGDPCPAAECSHCNEATGTCADDVTTPCGSAVPEGVCDGPDHCDGMGGCAPGWLGQETPCRPSAQACDLEDRCPGDGPDCSVDIVVANGTPCGDGLACNGEETCRQGACATGQPVGCVPGHACLAAMCVEGMGCVQEPIAGCCLVPMDCDDGNPCTRDLCGVDRACTHAPMDGCVQDADGGTTRADAGARSGDAGPGAEGGGGGGGCGCVEASTPMPWAAVLLGWMAWSRPSARGTPRNRNRSAAGS